MKWGRGRGAPFWKRSVLVVGRKMSDDLEGQKEEEKERERVGSGFPIHQLSNL